MVGPEPSDEQWDEIFRLVDTLPLTNGEIDVMREWAEGYSPYTTEAIMGWLRSLEETLGWTANQFRQAEIYETRRTKAGWHER